jgi:hypothetical protein
MAIFNSYVTNYQRGNANILEFIETGADFIMIYGNFNVNWRWVYDDLQGFMVMLSCFFCDIPSGNLT